MGLVSLLFLFPLLALPSFSGADISAKVGICYGQLGNNLPTPSKSAELIHGLKAKRVKIYDANPNILKALGNSDVQVSVMVPNEIIPNISSDQALADRWVETNVVPFYGETKIRYLLVGNEILSNPPNATWFQLVPAMRKIRRSVKKFGLRKIKVGTPLAMDMLEASYPPSSGAFRSDLTDSVFKPLLQFLDRTNSFFFFDVYPYFAWAAEPTVINLDYSLLEPTNITVKDPGSGLTYNRNVVKKFTSKTGTPARPGVVIPTLIFALYNENQKTGPGTERHFGLLYPNGTNIYGIDLSGETPESEYPPLPKPTTNQPYKGKVWCVVAPAANLTEVGDALSYACGQGNRTCNPIQPGGACYEPNSLIRHASYAFSSYWAQFRSIGGTCYFNGLAVQTTDDPSYGACKYPSITL
nr:probable glucan endo-1,3-beta-glucosidase A6 [Ipomoea batatas]GME16504.1 probable glucan endo-1,3-beta-glucosidase A6 [Ipomoea batatas]